MEDDPVSVSSDGDACQFLVIIRHDIVFSWIRQAYIRGGFAGVCTAGIASCWDTEFLERLGERLTDPLVCVGDTDFSVATWENQCIGEFPAVYDCSAAGHPFNEFDAVCAACVYVNFFGDILEVAETECGLRPAVETERRVRLFLLRE